MHPEWSTESLFVKNSKILISSFFIVETLQSKKPYENGPVSNIVYIGASIPLLRFCQALISFESLVRGSLPPNRKVGGGGVKLSQVYVKPCLRQSVSSFSQNELISFGESNFFRAIPDLPKFFAKSTQFCSQNKMSVLYF